MPDQRARLAVDSDGPGLADLVTMSVTLALYLAMGFALGWLLDLPFHTFPVLALVGLLLGIVGACRYFYKQYQRFQ